MAKCAPQERLWSRQVGGQRVALAPSCFISLPGRRRRSALGRRRWYSCRGRGSSVTPAGSPWGFASELLAGSPRDTISRAWACARAVSRSSPARRWAATSGRSSSCGACVTGPAEPVPARVLILRADLLRGRVGVGRVAVGADARSSRALTRASARRAAADTSIASVAAVMRCAASCTPARAGGRCALGAFDLVARLAARNRVKTTRPGGTWSRRRRPRTSRTACARANTDDPG